MQGSSKPQDKKGDTTTKKTIFMQDAIDRKTQIEGWGKKHGDYMTIADVYSIQELQVSFNRCFSTPFRSPQHLPPTVLSPSIKAHVILLPRGMMYTLFAHASSLSAEAVSLSNSPGLKGRNRTRRNSFLLAPPEERASLGPTSPPYWGQK